MTLEELQRAWEEQAVPDDLLRLDDSGRLSVRLGICKPSPAELVNLNDPRVLAARLQAKTRRFNHALFWRNFSEAAVAFFLAGILLWMVAYESLPRAGALWVCLTAIGLLFVFDQLRQRKDRASPGDSVLTNVRSALREVDHQLWLLKNAFWWYWIPCVLCMVLLMYERLSQLPPLFYALVGGMLVFLFALTQWRVRRDLVPLRNELAELLQTLEPPQEGDWGILPPREGGDSK